MREREIHQLTEEDFQDIRCRVRDAIRKQLLGESDREDAEQELAIRLMKRGKKFRKSKGEWISFRALIIRSKLHEIIRSKHRPCSYEKRRALFSIDDPVPSALSGSEDILWKDVVNQDGIFADGTENAEELEHLEIIIDVQEAIASMPHHLQKLSRLLMSEDGITKQETAVKLKVSERRIYYMLSELKKFLRNRGFDGHIQPQICRFSLPAGVYRE